MDWLPIIHTDLLFRDQQVQTQWCICAKTKLVLRFFLSLCAFLWGVIFPMEVQLWESNSSAGHSCCCLSCLLMDLRVNVTGLERWNCLWKHSRFQFQMFRINAENVDVYVKADSVVGHCYSSFLFIPPKGLFKFSCDCFFVICQFVWWKPIQFKHMTCMSVFFFQVYHVVCLDL